MLETKIIAVLFATTTLLAACSDKPESEAQQVVRFLRQSSPDDAGFQKFPREYWVAQCLKHTQVWKTALQLCSDNGPHNPICDTIVNMNDCRPQ